MPQKKSSGGFVEILILLAGLTGLTAFGIIKTVPNIVSQPQAAENITISPIISPVQIPTATETITPDPLTADYAIGVGLTEDLQLEVHINGEDKTVSLLGIEPLSSDSAHCIGDEKEDVIAKKITGKTIYLVNYDTSISTDKTPLYAFLEDASFLNKDLIANGLATINDTNHPYYEEFVKEQIAAKENKRGIWSDTCTASPTPTEIQLTTRTNSPTPTLTPTLKPSPTKTPTPTINVQTNVKGESTHITPTITPTITLKDYINASITPKPIANPLNADLVLQLINLHRKALSLPPFEKDPELCTLAESRATEIDNEIFGGGTIHAGFRARNIPYWITENMAGYGSEQANVAWWLGSTIHRSAIEGNAKYSCGACTATSCVQLFTSYIPK